MNRFSLTYPRRKNIDSWAIQFAYTSLNRWGSPVETSSIGEQHDYGQWRFRLAISSHQRRGG